MISPDHVQPPSGRPLTGRAVLFMFIAFFGTVFAVNFYLLRLATGTFAGLETDSSYRASQRFNQTAQEAREQAARGWQVETAVTRFGGEAEVTLVVRDAAGRLLDDLDARVHLSHPASIRFDKRAVLRSLRGGRYAATLEEVSAGQWDVIVSLDQDGKTIFRSRDRIMLR